MHGWSTRVLTSIVVDVIFDHVGNIISTNLVAYNSMSFVASQRGDGLLIRIVAQNLGWYDKNGTDNV